MTVLAPSIGAFLLSTLLIGATIMAKVFSQEEIDILSKSPYIKNIRVNRITFTYEFRLILWENWVTNPSVPTIINTASQYGLDTSLIGYKVFNHINGKFKINGKPSRGKNKVFGVNSHHFKTNERDNSYLISTGKFIKGRKGIAFHPDFINEIYHEYPNKSIEDKLKEYGIDTDTVGYQRIYNLKQKLEGKEGSNESSYFNDDTVESLTKHPYIKRINNHQLSFHDDFYNDAYVFKSLHIDDILDIFEIDYTLLNISRKNNIKYKLNNWDHSESSISNNASPLMIKINNNRINKLIEMIDGYFKKVRGSIKTMTPPSKKVLCQWISDLPHDKYDFTVMKILNKAGISKTSYYSILSNPNYGKKRMQDDEDIKLIRKVLDSDPKYPMGSRTVYMNMKKVTNQQFGRKKIMRLMKKYDLQCSVRKANSSRQAAQAMLKKNVKPNILRRQFRFYRPLHVFLTDVSYLKYGQNKTAYLSTIKDSASGRILACVVSESNDLKLVDDTISQLGADLSSGHILFHSDQGILYLNDSIQSKISKLGFTQSMSRRGNCWDNASQESYFGHFKDECDYSWCSTIDEIRNEVLEYIEYYNHRRPQWNRNKMTPVEFEKYLLDMIDEDFDKYVDKEKQKYDTMMAKAKAKAIKRAHDIGAI